MNSIDESTWIPPRTRNTVNWRGIEVTEKGGIALRHLFDDMQDYFGQPDGEPNVSISITSKIARRLDRGQGNDSEAKGTARKNSSNTTAPELSLWRGNLEFTYKINNQSRDASQKLNYMSMDVCIDMTPKKDLDLDGHNDMKDYGRTWIYAYSPRYTIETFIRYFESGTGFKVSSEGLVLDEERHIVHFEPKLLTEPHSQPGFWIVDDDGSKQFTRVGTIHEAYQDPVHQFLFRCICIFAVSVEVEKSSSSTHGQSASATTSADSRNELARLTFTLVHVRPEGIVDNIAPIIYNPRRSTKYNGTSNNYQWWD